jgi:hypothetical protein
LIKTHKESWKRSLSRKKKEAKKSERLEQGFDEIADKKEVIDYDDEGQRLCSMPNCNRLSMKYSNVCRICYEIISNEMAKTVKKGDDEAWKID